MRFLPLLTIAFLLIISCTGNKTANGNDRDSTADSITADSLAALKEAETLSMLPDTAFESTSLVKFRVDTYCDSVDSVINDLHSLYDGKPGVFAFRGSPSRQADFGGKVKGRPDTIIVDWKFITAFDTCKTKFGVWGGGSGWTGQPLYVNWPDSMVRKFKDAGVAGSEFRNKEIIVGSLCHNVYFIDFETGTPSRNHVDAGNPIKGTISLDPTLNGNLYVGQGVPAKRPFGHMVVDIKRGEISKFVPEDHRAARGWGAFDSSPIRVGQFLFWPGENGSLYKYICKDGDIQLHSVLRYTRNGAAPGMEASISIYRNYGYTADNHGNVLCINLNTMRPVWCFENGDDTDASIVVCEEDGKPYIYTGCEIDRKESGVSYFRKLDALTGKLVWEATTPGQRVNIETKHFDGGFYASPLPGKGNCENLIFTNCVTNIDGQNGEFIAIDRTSGEVVYRTKLKRYAWSSPVGFLNENGEMFIFTGDTYGHVYLINGADGKIIYTAHIGDNFESSPVVIDNHVVVGSRGRSIFKMTIQ